MKNKKLISKLGYSDGSPFKDEPYLDIHTPNGKIDMSNTGVPLLANGRILPPYSGIHHFDTDIVREIPLPKAQSLGEIKDRLSNYLSGNEGLLPGNQTSIKQSVKDRLYNSVTPIAYDPKHAIKEFVAGKQLPFMWDGKETSFNEFQNQPMFRGDTEYGEYSKNASMDAWGNYLGMPQKYDTFKQSSYQPGSFSFNNDDDIWDDVLHLDIINKLKEGQDEQVYDSAAGGFSLNNYILKKELDKDIDMPYVSYRDENDYNIKLGPLNIEGESIVGNPFNVYGRMYYDPETNERLSEEDIYKLKLEKSKYRNLQKQEGGEYEELELTDEEIEEYKKGGYVVEELPKAQNGLIVHDQNDPRLIAYKDSLWLHENNLDPYYNWDGVWKTDSGENMLSVLTGRGAGSSKPTVTSNSSIIPELSIKNRKSNIPLYTKGIKNANSNNSTKNYYPLPNFFYDESETKNLYGYSDELIKDMNYRAKPQAIKNNQIKYLEKNPEEGYTKGWGEFSELGGIKVEGKSQDESPYFKHFDNIPANKPEIYYTKDFYDRWHNNLSDTYFTLPYEDYQETMTHYARYAKPKRKVTYVPKNNVGDNSNWPTSNSYKSSYGIIKKPSYADAYKNVDKDKYPTLESFIEAAENYKKYGSNTKPESKPEETKVLKSETKEKKLKKPTTKKEVIKKPEIPEGYALSKGYQRDGISYGDMWHDIESTRPSIPAGPTMKDYYAKYPKSSDIAIDDDDFQSGGTVSQLWKQATGTPWSEAKKQGLTNGSYANNIALRKRIISGEFNSVPSQTSSRYIKEDFDYEKYGENIKRLLEKGNTLDDLVRKRIGTRAGLTNMFPELFDMPQMPEIPEQTFEPLTQNLPDAVVEEDVEVSNNSMFNVPDWISNPVYSPPITPVTPNTQVKDSKEEPSKIPFWITKSPIELDPNYTFPEKNKKQDGLKSFLSQFENDQELLTDEQRQSLYLSVDQEKDVQKKAELIQQKEKEYLNQLKIEEQQRIDDYKNQMLVQYGKDKISDLKQVGKNVYEETISNINEIKNNTQEKSNKISYYIKNAPWEKGYKNITDYFKLIGDTYLRSEALISSGSEEATKKEVENTAFSKDVKRDLNDYYNNNFKNLYPEENEVKKLKTIKEISDEYKPIADIEKGIDDLGYNKTNYPNFKLGKVLRDNKGSSTHVIDMSDGINVTYQPRNENANKRSNVNNAVTVSDYLYDQDFTDGYVHEHAFNRLNKLKNKIGNFNKKDQKFVTIREKTGDDTWNVRVIPTSKLKESDFGSAKKLPIAIDPVSGKEHQDYIMSDNKVYSQGYAVLSDFDISSDGNKIKLYSGSGMFRNQGIPLLPNDSGHVLRLPGGVGNYGKYQSIDKLNSFGPYIGGTVTIISDDGKIVKKITGSLKDIVRTAQNIQKQTNGAEVHFLQSDAGSMNVKASANNNNIISKDRLNILRNNEPWAGGSEILLNKKVGGEINQFKLGGQYMDLDLTEEEIKEYQKGGFVVEDLPEYQAPPGQVISSTYSEYPFQIPEMDNTNLNDTIRPYSDKKRFNSYTITGDPNKPHRRSAGNIIYDMFHKPGSSEIKHDFNFKYGGENKYQTPPGEVKDLWNTLPNSYPEKGNPAIDMLDLDVFGILNDFVVQPAKRVIQDPVGTVKSIGNTAADVASFFNPFSIGSAEPLIESMVNKDIDFGGDGNNAFGTPYWTDNALALDATVFAPLLGKSLKTLKTLPNKFPNAYKYNPWAYKPDPKSVYRGIGKEGTEDALESGVFRPKQNVDPNMSGSFNLSKDFNKVQKGTYYSPNFEKASEYGKGYIAEVPRDAADFTKTYKSSDWSLKTRDNIPIEQGKILKPHWLKGHTPVKNPSSKSLPNPLRNLYKYNPFATNLESKIAKENLLARQIYGDEAYENFLKHGPVTEYSKDVPRHKQIRRWLDADTEDVVVRGKAGKNEGKFEVASSIEGGNFKYPYFQKSSLFFSPTERALYNADMGKGRVIIPKDVDAKSFYPAGETSYIRNVDTAPKDAAKMYSGEKYILSPFDKNAFNSKAFDVYEETPHWLMGNRKIQRHGGNITNKLLKNSNTINMANSKRKYNRGGLIAPVQNTLNYLNLPEELQVRGVRALEYLKKSGKWDGKSDITESMIKKLKEDSYSMGSANNDIAQLVSNHDVKSLTDFLKSVYAIPAAIGTGTVLSQEKNGGEIGYKSEEEIRDLINQGYDIEYLD